MQFYFANFDRINAKAQFGVDDTSGTPTAFIRCARPSTRCVRAAIVCLAVSRRRRRFQFNALTQRVMTSVVLPDCRVEFRARIIEKWIDVAKELRALKNFSALRAIVSSLQSEPVHRLKSAWSCVSKCSTALFRELNAAFESADESSASMSAGATSSADERDNSHRESNGGGGGGGGRSKRVSQCRRTKSDVNLADSQGCVPYLGSFLSQFYMLDQALPDTNEGQQFSFVCTLVSLHSKYCAPSDGLINFEKRRREFELMAKLRLFQSAARAYTVSSSSGHLRVFSSARRVAGADGPRILRLVPLFAEPRRERMVRLAAAC